MTTWSPTADQARRYEEDGYFIVRNVIPRETAAELRGVIKNTVLMPEPDVMADADPMDPMGDSAKAREARFRKLSNYCFRAPLIWLNVHGGPAIARIASYFLGDDLVLKFNSCFLKPARTGSATPWHQDNGLWRDGDTAAFNFWMALDPATRANGCLQMMPGSHKGGDHPARPLPGQHPRRAAPAPDRRHSGPRPSRRNWTGRHCVLAQQHVALQPAQSQRTGAHRHRRGLLESEPHRLEPQMVCPQMLVGEKERGTVRAVSTGALSAGRG